MLSPSKTFIPRFLFGLTLCVCLAASATVQLDVKYGQTDGVNLLLDVSVPEGSGPFPTIILVHGGGWTAGDKSGGPKRGYMAPMHEALSRAGFAWFSINYRLAPRYHFPAALEDVESAIRWVKTHSAEYHLDPKRLALSGESAGGQLVALAAVRADESTRVAAVIPFYGVFDFVAASNPQGTLNPSFKAFFGRDTLDETMLKVMHTASSINFVKPGLPPFLLLHGTADKSVPYQQSLEMQARLRRVGVPCDLITVPNGPHGMLDWAEIVPDFKEQVVAWLKTTLGIPR